MIKISNKIKGKAVILALVGLSTAALPVAPALADGWHHGGGRGGYSHYRGGHGGGGDGAAVAIAAGVGLLLGAALMAPPPEPVYAPAPAYAPPPPYYRQSSAYYGEPLDATPASDIYRNDAGQYCREYQSTVRVGGRLQTGYGTACQQPDGSWRVAN